MAEDARRKMTTRLVIILLVFNIVCGAIIWRSAVGTSELGCQLDFAMSQTIGAETDWSAAEDTTARNAHTPDAKVVAALQRVNRERVGVLKTALGDSYTQAQYSIPVFGADDTLAYMLEFLPREKLARVVEVSQKHRAQKNSLSRRDDYTDDLEEREAALERQVDQEIASLLSPSEKFQYDLRVSRLAEYLRYELHGFDPTAAEFEAIFAIHKRFNDGWDHFRVGHPNGPSYEEYRAAYANMELEINDYLGSGRFAEFVRAGDYSYKQFLVAAENHGAAPETAAPLYDLSRRLESQASDIRAMQNIGTSEKQYRLQVLRSEFELAVSSVFGTLALEDPVVQEAIGMIDYAGHGIIITH